MTRVMSSCGLSPAANVRTCPADPPPKNRIVTGMIVHENEGKTIVGNAEGQLIELKTADIETRTPQKISVMPEKLTDRMTLQELRDLIAFLDAQK